jgi:hypothetical protein
MSTAGRDMMWIKKLLYDIQIPIPKIPVIGTDSLIAADSDRRNMSTRHTDVRYKWVKGKIKNGELTLDWVETGELSELEETLSSDIKSREEALGPLCQPIESQSQCSSGLGDTLRNKFGREARGSLPVTHYDQALVPVDKQSPTTVWRAGLDYAGDWSSSHRLRHCNSQVIFAL